MQQVTHTEATSNVGQTSRFLRFSGWVSFVLNVLIIATGGAVRLTGSGLGCNTWPKCTADSFVNNPEMGIHSYIEFGNRTLSGPLLIFAILVFALSLFIRKERKDLVVLSSLVLLLVALQAVIGGIVVLMHLNANLVGVHYIISLVIVCFTAAFIVRMYDVVGVRELDVPKPFSILAHITTFFMAVTIFVGVLTTSAGPHSGDDRVIRESGFDASLLAHIHAWPGYISLALVVVLVVWSMARSLRPRKWILALLIALVAQIVVGIYQARHGLPPLLVGIHMVLASLTAAAMTVSVLRLKKTVK